MVRESLMQKENTWNEHQKQNNTRNKKEEKVLLISVQKRVQKRERHEQRS